MLFSRCPPHYSFYYAAAVTPLARRACRRCFAAILRAPCDYGAFSFSLFFTPLCYFFFQRILVFRRFSRAAIHDIRQVLRRDYFSSLVYYYYALLRHAMRASPCHSYHYMIYQQALSATLQMMLPHAISLIKITPLCRD